MPGEMQESVERERGKRPREAGGGPGARACRESGTLVAYPSFYKYLNGICASKNVPYLRTFCAWLESGDRRKGAACWRRTADRDATVVGCRGSPPGWAAIASES